MSIPILALIPSGYKAQEVYSVIPSDGSGDFSFNRNNGKATRVNKDGLIEEVLDDTPRLDYLNSTCPSLLLEEQKTNELSRSEDFNNWTKTNITIASDSTTSPSGNLSADTITRNSALTSYVTKTFTKEDADQYEMTLSVFVKKNVGDFFAIRTQSTTPNRADAIFQFSTKTFTTSQTGADFQFISAAYKEYDNDWYRLSLKVETDFAATLTSLFSPRSISGQVDSTDSSSDSSVFLWGAQCEYNGLTSYIPTDSAIKTRFAETCTVTTPADVTTITETFADNTTNIITTIPTTFSASIKEIKKIIMD
tara:strand:+ start:616 stop:1539 length:924 start_codon:yes stop_codon:yes gene_type:complete